MSDRPVQTRSRGAFAGDLLARVARSALVAWPLRIVRGMLAHSAFLAASAMAFNFFLSFVPLLALFGFLLGHVVSEHGAPALLAPVGNAVPFLRDVAVEELGRLAGASVTIAPLSVAGFLWVTSSGTVALIDTFELALGTKRRPWWQQRLIAVAWVVAMLVAFSLAFWAISEVDDLFAESSLPLVIRLVHAWDSSAPTLLFAAATLLSLGGLAALYRVAVVHAPSRRRVIWRGALASAVSMAVVTLAFSAYVQRVARYALFYGSLATVATVLVWLYLLSLALLLGAELNAQLELGAPNEQA